MSFNHASPSKVAPMSKQVGGADQSQNGSTVVDLKARQAVKIREIAEALIECNITKLDAQARALGLSRSTTWTIIKASHKSSGLSPLIINRMLASSQLPTPVRGKILEYIKEKTAGLYGDSKARLCKFNAHLSIDSDD